jgi:hypothetical protein
MFKLTKLYSCTCTRVQTTHICSAHFSIKIMCFEINIVGIFFSNIPKRYLSSATLGSTYSYYWLEYFSLGRKYFCTFEQGRAGDCNKYTSSMFIKQNAENRFFVYTTKMFNQKARRP